MKKFIPVSSLIILFFALSLNVFSQQSSAVYEETIKSEVVKKAYKKLDADDVSGAIKLLDGAVEKKQDLFEVYKTRAFIRRFYIKDMEGAISDLNKVLGIKPDDIESYTSLAFILQAYKNDYQGALGIYETAQKYQPDSAEIYTRKAFAKSKLKDYDGAMTDMQSAIKLNPESVDLRISMSDLLTLNNKPVQAIANLQSFLDADLQKRNGVLPKLKGEKIKKDKTPRNPDGSSDTKINVPVRRYSQMVFSANSPAELKKQQDQIDDARNLAKAYIALGKFYIAQNNFDKAFANLNTALMIDRNQEEAFGLRGVIYLSRGENEKAIIELTNAAVIASEPYFYLNRGIAYLFVKKNKEAQADFDYFLKLYPDGKAVLDQRIADAKQQIK